MTYSIVKKQLRVVKKRKHQNKSKRSSALTPQLNRRGVSVSTNVTTIYWDEDDDNDDDHHDEKYNSIIRLQIDDDEGNDSITEGIDRRHSVQISNSCNNNNSSSCRNSRRYKRRNFKTSNMLLKDVREIFKQHNIYPQQSYDNYPQQHSSATSNNTNKTGKAKHQLLTKQLIATDSLKETMRLIKDLKLVNT
ncbi:hypothetical protein FRACYDRAFT_254187 [Fragilariopsis cylindrus CCMP1102]|uniref:Uncharacterized protein n=1 Tax=Fragilariopsis cylindrus CCMP1102 TaxID=635003 RepID=A0A1E7EL74_9STRA|nr:hypothetical protein FRACYDRAFT_254187 [Fragilariopsis cylindrus CCMP1102]|eukprot:OEU06636.1 hypothetical protein FRACYDRAFT_254187 [Fragilariopsis cylindrus CCMP1102]